MRREGHREGKRLGKRIGRGRVGEEKEGGRGPGGTRRGEIGKELEVAEMRRSRRWQKRMKE